MEKKLKSSFLYGGNAAFLEDLYDSYLEKEMAISEDWQDYFSNLQKGQFTKDVSHTPIVEELRNLSEVDLRRRRDSHPYNASSDEKVMMATYHLVDAYRRYGHFSARINPLNTESDYPVDSRLLPSFYHLSAHSSVPSLDCYTTVPVEVLHQQLQTIYCSSIGYEYMHIANDEKRCWLKKKIESLTLIKDVNIQKRIAQQLLLAETFESYLAKRFVAVKRFGLEGGESLMVALGAIIDQSTSLGVQEVIFGMSHRGRLNMLVNLLGKSPAELFLEFEGKHVDHLLAGDVKYHQGYTNHVKSLTGTVRAKLLNNPSHLELVDPVLLGYVRARQTFFHNSQEHSVLPILMHGDAAVAGQGVVMETLNFSQTSAYGVGGTVHIIVNNQVGFTTSNPKDARTGYYCSDIMKSIDAPIFHVNGDDPEAVLAVTMLALEFRQKFLSDVAIDLVCYRRLGHNEQDDPFMTQPQMYQKISKHSTVFEKYTNQLVEKQVLTPEWLETQIAEVIAAYDRGEHYNSPVREALSSDLWLPHLNPQYKCHYDTAIPLEKLQSLGAQLVKMPDGFMLSRNISRVMHDRSLMYAGSKDLDWGGAENLAYATLLDAGYSLRISGQDCQRGTFSHRHAVTHHQGDIVQQHMSLAHINPASSVEIWNSVLSENSVLGFEYGYALTLPNTLVIWEAQFGDFANCAQTVFDQYISSGEAKWGAYNHIVCLLPHGYEGQGAEHSSARFERYLGLYAEHNMEVCVPSNAAQIFHLLRRHMMRAQRRPLVVMTPKSLLRKPEATVSLEKIAKSSFMPVIFDKIYTHKRTKGVIFCSGKVYYDLCAYRDSNNLQWPIVRIEQLAPFPEIEISQLLAELPATANVVWCQEEPENMGAASYVMPILRRLMLSKQNLYGVARPMASSPAVGYLTQHQVQQQNLVKEAFSRIANL